MEEAITLDLSHGVLIIFKSSLNWNKNRTWPFNPYIYLFRSFPYNFLDIVDYILFMAASPVALACALR